MSGDDQEDALEQSYESNFQLSFHPGIGASVWTGVAAVRFTLFSERSFSRWRMTPRVAAGTSDAGIVSL